MVHALKEIWRVLVPDGYLIDLRPHATNWPLEVVAGSQVMLAGQVDNAPFEPDEKAADKTIGHVVSEGWFAREQRAVFDCASYWSTLEDMLTYYAESGSPPLTIPENVLVKTRQLVTMTDASTKVRIRVRMVIARYRKLVLQL
jgi:hypothetical protein